MVVRRQETQSGAREPLIVVCGVTGSGKSTVGRRFAHVLDVDFVDGDDVHSPSARATMQRGEPIDEAERSRWLARVVDAAQQARPAVIACSALGRRHRDELRRLAGVQLMMLDVARDELVRRLRHRTDHFAGHELLASQLASLEPPSPTEGVVVIDADQGVDDCVSDMIQAMRSR